jgi:thiopeptide-type bacteriocin biosynthesis protein
MRHLKGFSAAPFFVLRTPLLPLDELAAWSEGLEAPGSSAADLPAAVARDRACLRQRLAAVVARPEVREAIFLASPTLEERLDFWLHGPDTARGQRVEPKLVRYFERMASRPTPFGTLASYSVGVMGAGSRLELGSRATARRQVTLDHSFLADIGDALARDPALGAECQYQANGTLHRLADAWSYVESPDRDAACRHAQVEASSHLDRIIAHAQTPRSLAELTELLLREDPELEAEDAREYLQELVAARVLVPDWGLLVTAADSAEEFIARLRTRPGTHALGETLHQATEALHQMAAAASSPDTYRTLAGRLQGLPVTPSLGRAFKCDLERAAPGATLGQAVIDDISRAVDVLHRLSPNLDGLAALRRDFVGRYELREVPFLELFDPEAGLFGAAAFSGAAAGLPFPAAAGSGSSWGRREQHLLRLLDRAQLAGAQALELTNHDIDRLTEPDALPLPDSFYAIATLGQAPVGETRLPVRLHVCWGPSAVKTLTRFAQMDPQLRELIESTLRAEEANRPEAIFAEVVRLPPLHQVNATTRPPLRRYEIPCLGASSVAPEQQIPLSDLRVSVHDNRFVLRSHRLGREVIPCLSSATNHLIDPYSPYRFLCELQTQGFRHAVGWSWGALQDTAPVLPRVACRGVVFGTAAWRVWDDELAALTGTEGAERFAAAQALRRRRGLPRVVLLTDYDNRLVVDLDNILSLDAFVDAVKSRSSITLSEPDFPPWDSAVTSSDGRYANEVVGLFTRDPSPVSAPSRRQVVTAASLERRFLPGSQWLYARLFLGPVAADEALTDRIAPLAEEWLRAGVIRRWFFIRYNEGGHHLRVRLAGDPMTLLSVALPALSEVAQAACWRMELGTYERELERYGGAVGMELSEELFQHDSEAAVQVLRAIADDPPEARWRMALVSADDLLTSLGLPLEEKTALLARVRASFAREHRADGALKAALGQHFRQERHTLTRMLAAARAPAPEHPAYAVMRRRSARIAALVPAAKAGGLVGPVWTELAESYLHMSINRLLRTGWRPQELVIYDLLHRIYLEQRARGDGERD